MRFLLVHPEISLPYSGAKCGFEPYKQRDVVTVVVACVSMKLRVCHQKQV